MLAMLERERVRKETMTSSPSAHMLLPTISTSCGWRWWRRRRASCQPPFEKLQKLQWIFNQMGRLRSSLWSAPSLSPSFQTETWSPEDKDCIWKIFVWSYFSFASKSSTMKFKESGLKAFWNDLLKINDVGFGNAATDHLLVWIYAVICSSAILRSSSSLWKLQEERLSPICNGHRVEKRWLWRKPGNEPIHHSDTSFPPLEKCEVTGDWLMIWNETKLWFCCSFQWTHELTSSNRQYARFTIFAKFTIFNSFLSLNILVSTQLSLVKVLDPDLQSKNCFDSKLFWTSLNTFLLI